MTVCTCPRSTLLIAKSHAIEAPRFGMTCYDLLHQRIPIFEAKFASWNDQWLTPADWDLRSGFPSPPFPESKWNGAELLPWKTCETWCCFGFEDSEFWRQNFYQRSVLGFQYIVTLSFCQAKFRNLVVQDSKYIVRMRLARMWMFRLYGLTVSGMKSHCDLWWIIWMIPWGRNKLLQLVCRALLNAVHLAKVYLKYEFQSGPRYSADCIDHRQWPFRKHTYDIWNIYTAIPLVHWSNWSCKHFNSFTMTTTAKSGTSPWSRFLGAAPQSQIQKKARLPGWHISPQNAWKNHVFTSCHDHCILMSCWPLLNLCFQNTPGTLLIKVHVHSRIW